MKKVASQDKWLFFIEFMFCFGIFLSYWFLLYSVLIFCLFEKEQDIEGSWEFGKAWEELGEGKE